MLAGIQSKALKDLFAAKSLETMFGDTSVAVIVSCDFCDFAFKLLSGNEDLDEKEASLKELKLLYDKKKFNYDLENPHVLSESRGCLTHLMSSSQAKQVLSTLDSKTKEVYYSFLLEVASTSDTSLDDKDGDDAMKVAIINKFPCEFIQALLDIMETRFGSEVMVDLLCKRNVKGDSDLSLAVKASLDTVVTLLMASGFLTGKDIDCEGNSLLHFAFKFKGNSWKKYIPSLKDSRNVRGCLPLEAFAENNVNLDITTFKKMIPSLEVMNERNSNGETLLLALFRFKEWFREDFLTALLEAGASHAGSSSTKTSSTSSYNIAKNVSSPSQASNISNKKLNNFSNGVWSSTLKTMKIFFFLWFAGCLGANIYHIYFLIFEYSKYDISIDVQYVNPDVIQAPITVFCFPAWRIIRFKEISKEEQIQLLHKEPDEYSNETSWVSHDFNNQNKSAKSDLYEKTVSLWRWKPIFAIMANLRNNSIDEQFRLTADVKHIFQLFEIFVNNFTEGNVTYNMERYYTGLTWGRQSIVEQLFEIKQFMRDVNKCFSIQLKEKFREFNYKDVLRQPIYKGALFHIGINKTIASYADLMMFGVTGNDDPMSTASMCALHLHVYDNHIAFTYDTYVSKLLEYPYQTDCRNYSKGNFISQGDCHEKCVKQVAFESPDSLNMMPAYVSIQRNDTNPSGKNVTLAPVSTFAIELDRSDNYTALLRKKIQDVLSFCDKKCSQRECESEKFIPKLLTLQTKRHNAYVGLFAPNNPAIVVVSQPKYSFIEFITALFSTLGFWLGVFVFGFVFHAKTAEKVLIEKKVEMKRRKFGIKSVKFSSVLQKSDSSSEERQESATLRRFST